MLEDQTLLIAAIGLIAGLLGSIAGLGGSIFMIPLLTIILGADRYHLFMAAALWVNFMISLPAALQHYRKRAINLPIMLWILPAMVPAIAAGVLLSNRFEAVILARSLGVLIIATLIIQLISASRSSPTPPTASSADALDLRPPQRAGLTLTALITGLVSGLMGIGGGILLVPGSQLLARLPLKNAIAVSSATICLTAVIAASAKLATIDTHNFTPNQVLSLAAIMGAWGIIGSIVGSTTVHLLPTKLLRWIVTILLLAAAVRLILK